MRPKGVIGVLVVLLLVAGTLYFFADSLIESGIESAGESVIGARVEIDNLSLSLTGLSITWDRLQVANPNDTWQNLIETGTLSFDMEAAPLVRKKVVINDVTVADIRINSRRETDGKIDRPEGAPPGLVQQAMQSLDRNLKNSPILNLGVLRRKVNLDSLMAAFDIQSVHRLGNARQNIDSTFKQWHKSVTDLSPEKDLAELQTDIDALRRQEVAGLEDLVSAVDRSKRLIARLNELKQNLELQKKVAAQDIAAVTSTLSQVDNWIQDDFAAIKAKANLGDFSPQNVGKMLFGDAVVKPTLATLEYVALARKYMPIAQKLFAAGKVEKPARFEGQDIRFPLFNSKPNFLIEHMLVSAASNASAESDAVFSVSGNVNGVTTEPSVYGKPTTFLLQALLPNSSAYAVNGELDHVGDIAADRFEIKAKNVSLLDLSLPERPYLPVKILTEKGDLGAKFELIGERLNFRVELNARPVRFQFSEDDHREDAISRITRSVFASIQDLNFSAGVMGPVDDLALKISSNIDDILAQRISAVVGESVRVARKEIQQRIEQMVEPKRQELVALVDQNRNQIQGKIAQYQTQVDEKLAVVEARKREIETKIDEKKKEGVEGAKGKLKDLFQK